MFGLAGAVESAAGAEWVNENAAHTAVMSVEVRFIDTTAKIGGKRRGKSAFGLDVKQSISPPSSQLMTSFGECETALRA